MKNQRHVFTQPGQPSVFSGSSHACNPTPDIIWQNHLCSMTGTRCAGKKHNSSPDSRLPLYFLKAKAYKHTLTKFQR